MIVKTQIDRNTHVYNYIHGNGVQTTVKVSPSGHYRQSDLDRSNPVFQNKQKYSVIISSSKGCPLSCKFCHLTELNKPHIPLTADEIVANVMEAITATTRYENLNLKYIKLCYMGEGEAILNIANVRDSAITIINNVIAQGKAAGVDGIDIATALPKVGLARLKEVVDLNHVLQNRWPLNPYNHILNVRGEFRSIVRLFYSMHHADETQRDELMPGTMDLEEALRRLNHVANSSVNVVFHYMFMHDINDSEEDIDKLVATVNALPYAHKIQFRILRYNPFSGASRESERLTDIVKVLQERLKVDFIKVQYSAGEEIKGACGMFMEPSQ